jgi:FtsP/CotA-like multicopper oxidase with cupredoxin domain
MYYLTEKASRIRRREAQRARDNRAEIVKALSHGQITRRDLYKWGLFMVTGMLAMKNGLSALAPSAFADGGVPTGTPRSPLFGVGFNDFTQQLPRLQTQQAVPLLRTGPKDIVNGIPDPATGTDADVAVFPAASGERPGKRSSYHNDFTFGPNPSAFTNPLTGRGPIEGRPPAIANGGADPFAHQRWSEFFPKVGYVMSWAPCAPGTRFHPDFPDQEPNSVWCYGSGNTTQGTLPPFLIQAAYGAPSLTRIYNHTPVDRTQNNGFGRNESQLHFHNAHNGAESDGAANVHHFPGTFYDYRWSTTLARRDKINTDASDPRASGPNGKGGLINVAGDYRELQGSMWAHDHRFFFTAENVYKGNLGMVSYYSGKDRGNEVLDDGINLRLPSGQQRDFGCRDFDLHLIVSDAAMDPDGQLFFDIFDTDGFLGDVMLVNFAYRPNFNVLPRKYRFRVLSAGMSRFLQLQIADPSGKALPFQQIANDGNLLVNPVTLTSLDQQGTGERYDIVVDFSRFSPGQTLKLVNTLQQTDGRLPDGQVSLAQALKGVSKDPAVGPIMQFTVVSSMPSFDNPSVTLKATDTDYSQVPAILTDQIPIVAPVRTRVVTWADGEGDSRQPNGQCIPDCPPTARFPWVVSVNGGEAHSMNANRIQLLVPKPGEIEHWTYVNDGGEWDHPIHLHFEEGVTMNRGGGRIGPTELLARKDVWRLRPDGKVQFQIQFGEYGGSYVQHCHNTVHEDFALLMRIQLLTGVAGTPQAAITPTPNPTEDGVFYTTPEVLPEGDPSNGFGSPSLISKS